MADDKEETQTPLTTPTPLLPPAPVTTSAKMAGLIGNMSAFDSAEETWTSYIERLEIFIDANDIKDDKKVSTLLTVMGLKNYNLVKNLCAPGKPKDKTFDQIVKLVDEHLSPKPSVITERYKFSLRNQRDHESVSEYVVILKELSMFCDFKENLAEYLRDKLVSGLRNEAIKKRLLGEIDLTFEKAVSTAVSMEATDRDTAQLTQGHGAPGTRIAQLQRGGGSRVSYPAHPSSRQPQKTYRQHTDSSFGREGSAVLCFCCGKVGHMAKMCKFRSYKCNVCQKQGHLAAICKSKEKSSKSMSNSNSQKSNYSKKGYSKNRHNFVGDINNTGRSEQCSSSNEYVDEVYDISNLFQIQKQIVNKPSRVRPIIFEISVNGKNVAFEIDSGACVSVISEKYYEANFKDVKLKPTELVLSSYVHEAIKPIGQITVNVEYQGQTKQLDLYVIRNGSNPLLGRDWMKELELVISICDNKLNKTEVQSSSGVANKLVTEFPEVFTNELGTYTGDPVKLKIKDNAIPKYCRPRPIPFALKQKVEQELDRLVETGILTPIATSDWGTPVVPVIKSDGKMRLCADYRITLNPFLEVERYPIPKIEDLLASLQMGETFSKIDLSQAYAQVRLDEKSKEYCSISTTKGLFKYNRIPFGISTGPAIFQKIAEQVLRGIPGVIVFLDDILITGENQNTHLSRLREVCKRLRENGLTVKKDKCRFFCKEIEYLGFVLSKEGLSTSQNKVEAILKAPSPTNVTQLKSFLGLVNYYAKFLPNLSTMATPMYRLLQNDVLFEWDTACRKSFDLIKQKMVVAPILTHYNPDLPVRLTTDSSFYGIGCLLSQVEKDGSEKPICFGSRSLSKTEQAYSMIDKEALAIVYGVKKFNQYLFGRRFTLLTDHKPLLTIFGPKKGLPAYAAGRLQRYAIFLSQYDFDIQYIKSKSNLTADCLSRLPLNSKEAIQINRENDESDVCYVGTYLQCLTENDIPVNFKNIQVETQKDLELSQILKFVKLGWPNYDVNNEFRAYFQRQNEITVESNILMWGHRVIVPGILRKQLLDELHVGHMGVVKMKSIARSYLWWPGIDRDIELLSNSCSFCLAERANPAKCNLHVWEFTRKPWERINIDFLGPHNGKLYLIVVDSHTKWLEVEVVSSTAAVQTITKLRQMFARFGLPDQIVSDNGPPFSSYDFNNFIKSNGIRHTLIPSYHPASNGQAENSVRTVKKRLKIALSEKQNDVLALSRFLLAYRNAVHSTTNETPAKMMFRRDLKTRLDLIRPNVSQNVQSKQDRQLRDYGGGKTRQLYIGQPVLVRDYRGREKWIEAIVCKYISSVSYLVKLSNGIIWKRHIDQIITVQTEQSNKSSTIESTDLSIPEQTTQTAVSSTPARSADIPRIRSYPATPPPRSIPHTPHPHTPVRSPHDSDTPLSARRSPMTSPSADRVDANRRYPLRQRKPVEKLDL